MPMNVNLLKSEEGDDHRFYPPTVVLCLVSEKQKNWFTQSVQLSEVLEPHTYICEPCVHDL